MDLKNMLSLKSQFQKVTYYVIPFYNILEIKLYRWKTDGVEGVKNGACGRGLVWLQRGSKKELCEQFWI